jgi:ADP-glucose pyrophosphorylase
VEEAVVWERVRIGAGAVLRQCVIANDAHVGANAAVTGGAVVAPGAVVADGTRIPC